MILDEKPEIADAPGAVALDDVRGDIAFEHVSFTYPGRHETLRDS